MKKKSGEEKMCDDNTNHTNFPIQKVTNKPQPQRQRQQQNILQDREGEKD